MLNNKHIISIILLVMGNLHAGAYGDFYDETVLRTLNLEFEQADWWSQLEANYTAKENILATLTVDDQAYEAVGVRFRGNTSYQRVDSEKKPFNIEIDYTHEDQRLMGYKTLNLINCNGDPTFMREVLYSNACRAHIPSAKANFVTLVINRENWGVYANVQQLNGEFIEDWFPSNEGTRWRAQGPGPQTGDVPDQVPGAGPPNGPRPDGPPLAGPPMDGPGVGNEGGGVTDGSAALTWLGADANEYEAVYELKNSKLDDPWASLVNTCDVLNNVPDEQLPDMLEAVLNVDRALWVCAYEILFHDDDGYVNKRGSDYCLYYDPETGRIHLMQYDGNECMSTIQGDAWSLFYRADDPVVPLMKRLMALAPYRQRYLAHVRTVLNATLTEDFLYPKMEAYRDLIEAAVSEDPKKLYTDQAFNDGIDELKAFVEQRRNDLLAHEEVDRVGPEILSVDHSLIQDSNTPSVVSVTVTLGAAVAIEAVQLYVAEHPYDMFTPLAMLNDGEQHSGSVNDKIYTVTLPAYPIGTQLDYYVKATAADEVGTLAFKPKGAEHELYSLIVTPLPADHSPIVINEFMAKNESNYEDPQGDYDDWIELYNNSDETVDLSGMYMSDSAEKLLKWQFPENTTLAPGDYLIIWADEDSKDEPGLHCNFKLSAQGETLWLFDTDERNNMILDTVTFGEQQADNSFGRFPDGEGEARELDVPTPMASNGDQ